MTVEFEVMYVRSTGRQPGLAELSTFDGDTWDDSVGGEGIVCSRFECEAFSGVKVESVKLIREVRGAT